jgi:hypothetical protein
VRGPVTALVQDVVQVEIRCTKAVTGRRTPRARSTYSEVKIEQ